MNEQLSIAHPESDDLAFLYGVIITDGRDSMRDGDPSANVCVFADSEVDRSPTGSGVTARMAARFAHGQAGLGETRRFQQGARPSSWMTGEVVEETVFGKHKAVVVEVSGHGHYTGECCFELEQGDEIGRGFLLH